MTAMGNRTLIAIPAWNEQGSIAEVIGKVREHRPDADILVVNDGSSDATAELAAEAGALVVSLPFNVGVGGAMRTASSRVMVWRHSSDGRARSSEPIWSTPQ